MGTTENETCKTITIETKEQFSAYLKSVFPAENGINLSGEDSRITNLCKQVTNNGTLTEEQEKLLNVILPFNAKSISVGKKSLSPGECWDLSQSYGDNTIDLHIDELEMDTCSSIKCIGKVLIMEIGKITRKHSSYSSDQSYDIGIFGKDGYKGENGVDGLNGADGQAGQNGKNWSAGIAGEKGGDGQKGAPGSHGTSGGDGGDGSPVLITKITIHSLDEPITIEAAPGNGGDGGNGGNGGNGGKGGNGCDTGCDGSKGGNGGQGGNGGNGGNGGKGGNGGNGGNVDVYTGIGMLKYIHDYCSTPKGGKGGKEGIGGSAGKGGGKGIGGKHHGDGGDGSNGEAVGQNGARGEDGEEGTRASITKSELAE